ncbi:MAG: prepilin-type N-terminal cleavage/methylation domain-containing protein [Campylobacterota bacterium]|nr:prepilin-type N-terminal cleavage/methylation domain-containing protein [Campylobacterota bacterium]
MNIYKKSFTLVEILISISLFSIIILFLYQTLDMTQKSNDFYSSKLDLKKEQNNIQKILFLDTINQIENNNTIIENTKDDYSILTLKTSNTFHNPFYQHITYMVSKNKNLIRIESKNRFNQKKLNDDFFDNAYIDIILSDISIFKIKVQVDKQIAFYIKQKNNNKILFTF